MNTAPVQIVSAERAEPPRREKAERPEAASGRRFDEVLSDQIRSKKTADEAAAVSAEAGERKDSPVQDKKERAAVKHGGEQAGDVEKNGKNEKKPKTAITGELKAGKGRKAESAESGKAEELAAAFLPAAVEKDSLPVKKAPAGSEPEKPRGDKGAGFDSFSGRSVVKLQTKAAETGAGQAGVQAAAGNSASAEDRKTGRRDVKKAAAENPDILKKTEKAVSGRESGGISAAVSQPAADSKAASALLHTEGERPGKFRVVDQRRVKAESGHEKAESVKGDAFNLPGPEEGKAAQENIRTLEVSLGREKASVQNSGSLQASLSSRLKESLNSEIVKQAGVVVRDGGVGEIRLVIKPESLGKVRIQLSLNDNHIAGRIIVENNTVREIFESNLENLYKAFGHEGFEAGGLEVSVQGEGSGTAGGDRKPFAGKRTVAAIEDMIPVFGESDWREGLVNLVV